MSKYTIFKLKAASGTRKLFNFIKFLFPKYATCVNVYFLRRTNTFIKSKYSKNRQWSKSIVYFGLWFGVISAFAITYYTYRFLFVFSYLWWVPVAFVLAICLPHLYRQRAHLSFAYLKFWKRLFR